MRGVTLNHHPLQATLEEVTEADLLLHVLDASSPQVVEQREAVVQVWGGWGGVGWMGGYSAGKRTTGAVDFVCHV